MALGCTIQELLTRMSATEYLQWKAYYYLEPFGFERDDYHAALIAQTTANFAGRVKRPIALREFMLQKPEPEIDDEMSQALLNQVLGSF